MVIDFAFCSIFWLTLTHKFLAATSSSRSDFVTQFVRPSVTNTFLLVDYLGSFCGCFGYESVPSFGELLIKCTFDRVHF